MCAVFGRALWDDRFRKQFFTNPLAACQTYDGPAARASGLRALHPDDFKVLDKQLTTIRSRLGEEAIREVAENFGLQMIIGRAMLDRTFAERLQRDADGVIAEFLGTTASARKAASVLQTPGFKRLNGFAAQRRAMRGAGQRFTNGVAHGRAVLALATPGRAARRRS
jgi:hypothetical protein